MYTQPTTVSWHSVSSSSPFCSSERVPRARTARYRIKNSTVARSTSSPRFPLTATFHATGDIYTGARPCTRSASEYLSLTGQMDVHAKGLYGISGEAHVREIGMPRELAQYSQDNNVARYSTPEYWSRTGSRGRNRRDAPQLISS